MSEDFFGAYVFNKIIDVAEEAGNLILSHYKQNSPVSIKADGSRVTQADKESEKLILDRLKKLTPNIPIVSEETMESQNLSLIKGGDFWLVDPIDGTEGFIEENGDFAVNIGLIKNFQPYLGVIYSPESKLTYAGIANKSSFIRKKGEKKFLSASIPDKEGLIVLLYHILPPSAERDNFLQNIKIKEKRMNSDALRFPRVAAGEVDIHPFFETCYEWDTAAGHAILKGAGGNIITLDKKELTYGKLSFRNHSFLALGNFSIEGSLIESRTEIRMENT